MSARHVGETLAEALEERGEEQVLWAARVGCSTKHLSQIVTGKVGLSAAIAVRMEAFLGFDALTLMRIQAAYDVDVARRALVHASGLQRELDRLEHPYERTLDEAERHD